MMHDILEPPAERDLPDASLTRIRARVFANIGRPEQRHTARRVVLVAAAATAVAAGATTAIRWEAGGDVQALALSTSEMSPELREAADRCLTWNRGEAGGSVQVTLDDVAVAAQRGYESALLFLTDDGYFTCDVQKNPLREVTGGTSGDRWGPGQQTWLPGPVQRLSLSSSDLDGGDVTVIGRVSARVHRLVLDHGDGHTTTARLRNGAFGLISDGVRVRKNAALVSYDREGNEIDRRPLFRDSREFEDCYVDPAGTVLYHKQPKRGASPATDPSTCKPADAWGR